MDYDKVFEKIMSLYESHKFFWKKKQISNIDILSSSGYIVESVLRKASFTHSFLFGKKLSYSRKRLGEQNKEVISINEDKQTYFILLLIIIDIMEEATLQSDSDIHLDNFIK
ncbi:hypothetical protein BGC07_15210 [Piscirickettsia litoralis]|uniref:Uncharacterized protein n=1 Tax=Piscirickettsia litoralis TaxID=1891921 RepID=A0ABX3A2H5_9GAMM|nr:hypothetical protein BGC07_15210 [Piscirickettsia litoralis]